MAISTYSELKTAAANWLVRGDLTSRIPEFITLAEARLNRTLRSRLAESDQSLTGTVGSRTIALPATFAEPINLWWLPSGATARQLLFYEDPGLMMTDTSRGQPREWTVDGANVAFNRPLDAAYTFTLRMLAKYTLSDASSTNTLLTNAPDIYLFATLCEAAPFLRDNDLTNSYEAKLSRAIKEYNDKENRSRSHKKLSTEVGDLHRYGRYGGYNIVTDE